MRAKFIGNYVVKYYIYRMLILDCKYVNLKIKEILWKEIDIKIVLWEWKNGMIKKWNYWIKRLKHIMVGL